jgi:hypothetical protein
VNAPADAATELAPGTRLAGRYVLQTELGKGGIGAVYRARDASADKDVAFKVLLSTSSREMQALFEREYHTLASLKHPRIIEVYDYGVCEAGPYYTMELLDGQDLRDLTPLPWQKACRYLRDVASSLALLHARRLLHRDLSPRNVRLTSDGRAKLLDFGALASFGWASDIIGTPPFVAPEALLGAPLDQRADLFALGALSYWVLTGRHAFAAKTLEQLPAMWRTPAVPPSAFVHDIPEALDALVMTLLRFDGLARPSSATAVIDSLNAIAGLDATEHEQEAESYLASGALVGRSKELDQLRLRLKQASNGDGSAVCIEADPGIGKTRMLNELALEAQLRGATVLRVNAMVHGEPLGVAKALALALLRTIPGQALKHAAPHGGVLGRLSPEVWEALGKPTLDAVSRATPEARASMQDALLRWILAIAGDTPLLVAIDDSHAVDEPSAALLAVLASEARAHSLLLAVTFLRREPCPEGSALGRLRRTAARVQLGKLHAAEVSELVRGVFGDVEHAGRLGGVLYERSAGIPFECMELLRYAVSTRTVRYVDGTWVIPHDVSSADLPSLAEDVLDKRLSALSSSARQLVEALSVESGALTLERCLWLSEGMGEQQVFAALDELVRQEVLIGAQSSHRFAREAQRQALSAKVKGDRRQALHRALAQGLMAKGSSDPATNLEIGWHLLGANEPSQGADALTRVALDREMPREHAEQAVRGLEAALEVYERERRPPFEMAAVLLPLVNLGYYVGHRLVRQHGQRAVTLGLELTGLARARRLRRYLGMKLALIVALVIAGVRFRRARRRARARGLDYSLRDAIALTSTAGTALVGTSALGIDLVAMRGVADQLTPLSFFGKTHIGAVLHGFCNDLVDQLRGRPEVQAGFETRIALLDRPGAVKGMAEASRAAFSGGNLLALGSMQAYQHGQAALATAERLDALGYKLQAATANQIRMLYHAYRGEMQLAQEYRERFELQAVQGGSTWQAELWVPAMMSLPYLRSRDVVNLRRTLEQLTRQAKVLPGVALYAELTRGYYLLSRGDARAAAELFEKLMPQFPVRGRINWVAPRAALAAALNELREHARAREICAETIATATPTDKRWVAHYNELYRQYALAENGVGNAAEAARFLDEILLQHAHGDHPLFMGTMHQARAEVALSQRDRQSFESHLGRMEHWFKSTDNPALIALWERLREAGVQAGYFDSESGTRPLSSAPPPAQLDVTQVHRVLGDEGAGRMQNVLRRILSGTGAGSGYLFAAWPEHLELVASYGYRDAPEWLRDRLELLLQAHGAAGPAHNAMPGGEGADEDEEDEHEVTKTTHTQPFTMQLGDRYCRIVMLATARAGTPQVVGAAVIELEPDAPLNLAADVLAASAEALWELVWQPPAESLSASPENQSQNG